MITKIRIILSTFALLFYPIVVIAQETSRLEGDKKISGLSDFEINLAENLYKIAPTEQNKIKLIDSQLRLLQTYCKKYLRLPQSIRPATGKCNATINKLWDLAPNLYIVICAKYGFESEQCKKLSKKMELKLDIDDETASDQKFLELRNKFADYLSIKKDKNTADPILVDLHALLEELIPYECISGKTEYVSEKIIRHISPRCEQATTKLLQINKNSAQGWCFRLGQWSTNCVIALRKKRSM